jgi:cell division protein FtsI (penicillin-binding protein 3)
MVQAETESTDSPAPLTLALAKSSNVAAARLALQIGGARQRSMFEKLGLLRKSDVELAESARPIAPAPAANDDLTVAVLGYGHGLAISPAALAGAYTVFANRGARATLTLVAGGERAPLEPVFSPASAATVIGMMRAVVEEGTGAGALASGADLIGKTGTAEKPRAPGAAYDSERMLSSFVAMFPSREPRYVVVLALDEPERTAEVGGQATGGAVAAPAAGRLVARIAPMLPTVAPASLAAGEAKP